jgi:uncharacterized phage-like protein YoqJ
VKWVQAGAVWVPDGQQEAHAQFLSAEGPSSPVVAFSGHRPDKLLTSANDVYRWLLARLEAVKPSQAISGMALGTDTLGAIAALKLGIPLVAAVAFQGQDQHWPESDRKVYSKILARAADVTYVSGPGYNGWKYHARNQWMVDHADLVLAVWDGSSGGTKSCVEYALKKGVLIECFSQPGHSLG